MEIKPCPTCQGGWLCKPCQEKGLERDRQRSLAIKGANRALRQQEIDRVMGHFELESDEFLSAEEKAIHIIERKL